MTNVKVGAGVGASGEGCTHEGTVWQIESPAPGTGTSRGLWECTRCGQLWRRDPRVARWSRPARA